MGRRGHNEGSIFQRKDGRWVAEISIREPSGKLRRKQRYRKTRTDARTALREMQRQIEDGVQLTSKDSPLGSYLDNWLENVRPSLRHKTASDYGSIIHNRIMPHIGGLKLSQVNPAVVQGLYSDLADDGLSARSIINTHRVLHRALGMAVKWGLLIRNPCDATSPPRAGRPEMHILSHDQAERFLAATSEQRDHALYVVALTTGLR